MQIPKKLDEAAQLSSPVIFAFSSQQVMVYVKEKLHWSYNGYLYADPRLCKPIPAIPLHLLFLYATNVVARYLRLNVLAPKAMLMKFDAQHSLGSKAAFKISPL